RIAPLIPRRKRDCESDSDIGYFSASPTSPASRLGSLPGIDIDVRECFPCGRDRHPSPFRKLPTMTSYYDRIARKWHAATGAQGGALKKFVLNDLVIGKLSGIAGLSILELGAGNGYFMPLVLRRFSGEVPARIVITDLSRALLEMAQRSFRVREAEYLTLDVRDPFPFPEGSFDLIVANMVFNEIPTAGLRTALGECHRVLSAGGR